MKKQKPLPQLSKNEVNPSMLADFMDRYNLTEQEALKQIAQHQNMSVAPLVISNQPISKKDKYSQSQSNK